MLAAITRPVSPSIVDCALSHIERTPIEFDRAARQHRSYEECLRGLGLQVVSLPAAPALPDAVFVEDAAVVVDEVAVMTAPRLESRRQEVSSVAAALSAYRPLRYITGSATLEGGDVLRIDRSLFVGLSDRTNQEGVDQLSAILSPYGYQVHAVTLTGCLHLKSACTYLGRNTVLANRSWVDPKQLGDVDVIDVAPTEPGAANALAIGDEVILPASFPETGKRLEARGFRVHAVDVSELQKAEAGVTCCSILLQP